MSQHDVSIVISPRRGDMQRARAQRLSPVDAAQSITRLEGTDTCELGSAALPGRAVHSDEAGTTHGWSRGVES